MYGFIQTRRITIHTTCPNGHHAEHAWYIAITFVGPIFKQTSMNTYGIWKNGEVQWKKLPGWANLRFTRMYIYIYVHKYPKAWNGSVASEICITFTCENISQEHHRAGKMSAEQLWKNLKVHLAVLLPSLVVSCVKDVLPWVSIDCGKQMQKTTMVFIPRYKGLLSISLQPILAKILRRAKQGTGMDWETCEPQKEIDPNFFRISARAKSIGIHLSMYLSIYVYIYIQLFIYP